MPSYPSITELDRRLSLTTDPAAVERIERTKAIVRRLGADRQREIRAARATRPPEWIAAKRAELHPDGTKRCSSCARDLPFSSFPARPSRRDGMHPWCVDCYGRRTNPDTPTEGENR